MRVAFIGCVNFSFQILQHLCTCQDVDLVGVVTRKESSFNSDFQNLEPLAIDAGVRCFLAQGNDQAAMATWLRDLQPDVIYCFGWSYLLGKDILQIPRLGVVGYHPAALPKNRGRHPIIWALALDLHETASTFFFMDEGADSGDILNQVTVAITSEDNASTLYGRLIDTAKSQVSIFTRQLAHNDFTRVKQDHACKNYWRKRSKADGLIDWRMSAENIYNLVRALTKPYIGAHCIYREAEIKVWGCETLCLHGKFNNIEPGKVLDVANNRITVKSGHDAVVLIDHELLPLPQKGDYI
ncbi:MAG: formyltransferase family protein [Spirochaetales bacterium]|jgi:methionyl-tRNA formyltransferase|nr:formyltransferase family protein [Spirochaetales bacterium]